jgi:hypothetical protein
LSPEDREEIEDAAAIGKTVMDWAEEGKAFVEIVSPYSIQIRYGNMVEIFWELIRADLNSDGIEDILVFRYSRALGGTFGYGDVEIFTRLGPTEQFNASPV